MTLTATDLTNALNDERHHGYGLKGTGADNTEVRETMTDAIVAKANELGLDYEDLFAWTDSKHARWAIEEVQYNGVSVDDAVRVHLTRATVRTAKA